MTAGNVAEWLERSIGDNHAMSITHIQIHGKHKWIISTVVCGSVVRGEGEIALDAIAQFDRELENSRR